jgi:DNA-binding transcriptional ArsR family regulator
MGLSSGAQVDRVLAALADPRRRRVVELLRERPRRAGELAAALGLTPPALSRHLRTLRRNGLIEESHPGFDARARLLAVSAADATSEEMVAGDGTALEQSTHGL